LTTYRCRPSSSSTPGTIRWIDVHPDHTTRTEPQQILAAVDAAVYAD
jgi:hypothetical protein